MYPTQIVLQSLHEDMSIASKGLIYFSRFVVTDQVFFKTKYTYALVNLKPIVPGHVLIVPLRVVERLKDLTDEESIDYIRSIQTVHKFIEHIYKADSLNIAIQDGPEAGQSIPHLHTHIIPRHKMNNIGDEIYERMDSSKYDIDESLRDFYDRKTVKQVQKFVVKPDSDRLGRSDEEMHKEAAWLAQEFEKYIQK